jgi:hypothetical protein
MSNVDIAPPAPAPSQGVPIDPSPVSPPQPIGSQAPPAPVGDVEGKHHPQSRREATREAIRKAFARTEEPPKAAGSKMGHNQPPEATKVERRTAKDKAAEPLDLKKRPDDQRPRAEHGHFAAKADGTTQPRQQTQAGAAQRQGQPAPGIGPEGKPYNVVKLPRDAPYAKSPQRWRDQARAEWGAAPESVRGEVHRMHKEFSQAYQRMHGDAQEFARIRHFHDMARQHGTTLDKALSNYVGMENKLRSDPVAGLDVIVNNLNLRTPDGRRITLPDIAYHVLNQTPDQRQMLQAANTQTALAHQLAALAQQQNALARQQQQLQYERRFAHMRRGVDWFAQTHPRLDELGDLIQQELRLGFNLAQAYLRADRLRPATRAAQTRTQSVQTRSNTDRSIHGAPDGSNGARRRDKPVGRRDAIAKAIKSVNGSL